MFVVVTPNQYYLRSTIWTGDRERAARYDTPEQAKAALEKAKPFTKPAVYKTARIIEVK